MADDRRFAKVARRRSRRLVEYGDDVMCHAENGEKKPKL